MSSDAIEKPKWPPRRRLYLMRHGDVSYFDANGKPVRPDAVPLNERGLQQAEAARLELSAISFDRVVSSDLPRSLTTAAIVTAGQGVAVEAHPELQEIRPGRLADIPTDGLEEAFLGAFGKAITSETRFLHGETFGSLLDRVRGFMVELLDDPMWQRLLMVAHGGVNRAILTHALGSGLAGFAALEQDPCCLNILDVDDSGRWIVRLLNHTPYNPIKQGLELTTMEKLYQDFRGKFTL